MVGLGLRRLLLFPMILLILVAGVGCRSINSEEGLQVWIQSPMVKVMRDSKRPEDAGGSRMKLYAARNEMEFGQFVFRSDTEDITDIRLYPSELTNESGQKIRLDSITLYEVRYIYLPKYGKEYPDPLVPTNRISVEKGKTQPIWYEVDILKDTAPGLYTGKVDISVAGEHYGSIDIELIVWDFEIPDKPSMGTSFGLTYEYIDYWHHVEKASVEARALYDKYYWYMIKHRMTPRQPPADFATDEFFAYVIDPRVSSFMVPYNWRIEQWAKMLREMELLDKAYVYTVDEPITKGDYSNLRDFADVVHSIEPDLRFVVPYYRSPEFAPNESAVDYMVGYVDLWCPISSLFSNASEREKLKERQLAGETLWWYVCVGPQHPYANLHINMNGIDHRILFWQQKLYDVEGFLYWESIFWPYTGDAYQGLHEEIDSPWTDMATVENMNPDVYGDGSLLYPGWDVGIDGPVPSIRLKLAYKGMVDYEYFTMHDRVVGANETKEQIKRIVKDTTTFNRSTVLMDGIRKTVGDAIESGTAE